MYHEKRPICPAGCVRPSAYCASARDADVICSLSTLGERPHSVWGPCSPSSYARRPTTRPTLAVVCTPRRRRRRRGRSYRTPRRLRHRGRSYRARAAAATSPVHAACLSHWRYSDFLFFSGAKSTHLLVLVATHTGPYRGTRAGGRASERAKREEGRVSYTTCMYRETWPTCLAGRAALVAHAVLRAGDTVYPGRGAASGAVRTRAHSVVPRTRPAGRASCCGRLPRARRER